MHHDDEMTRVFERSMRQAERGRSTTLLWGIGAGVAGLAILVAAVLFGLQSSAPKPTDGQAAEARRQQSAQDRQPQQSNGSRTPAESAAKAPASAVQKASIAIGELGYEPSVIEMKAGSPIELHVAEGEGCAAGFLMPDLGVSADNSTGTAVVKLDPLEPGTYRFTCGMEMVEGRLVVE